ncbi:SusD/RagB family nutrient-binding outer membrane lipoprotein [Flavihumibacter fluvii]|uniref:SusD/RagB family nutrient-binding outer membrane lipoprotein n=1 Tax=Flavihumibacter fluvii TaxID=2838157 RepID=UPI001BDE0D3A|nr:SusD/RagB family nutrient-binding outer membrane lipoprotein [Flavihumibacter fluvii]ULQ53028.1 SusD/RagB family nutrient-binding outer membrane lipoprotein [Flavihumibacter fluvii]
MKNIFNKAFLAVATAAAFSTAGCDKVSDFGSTNTNPNGTPTPITKGLFTRAIAELGGKEGGLAISTMTRPGYYAQYFSETQYPSASLYDLPQAEFSGFYSAFLYDLQNIINLNTDEATKATVIASGSNANQIATCRILKAYAMWTITDRWGDIPYSEALKGVPQAPKYDTQESIYADLLKELTEAVDQFDGGQPMGGDIVYGGNIAKWKKFANSVRVQIALRMSKVYPDPSGMAATELKAALAHSAGTISTNDDNFVIAYTAAYQNPWYSTYVVAGRVDDAISSTMTEKLSSFSDPRIANYGTAPEGFPYGLDRPNAIAVPEGYGLILKGKGMAANDGLPVMNAATILFARAEAAERGWTSENAAALYEQAVTTSLSQWNHGDAAAAYLAQSTVGYGTTDHLEKIATQKWIAMYPDGLQAWCEWRRTGFPELTPSAYPVNESGEIPRRYVYGSGEYGNNNANVKEAAARLTGGDTQDARMWWDKE